MSDYDEAVKIVRARLDAARLPKPTLDEMIRDLSGVSAEIEAREIANVSAGLCAAPRENNIRRVAVLDALLSFLDAVKQRPRDVARRLNSSTGG